MVLWPPVKAQVTSGGIPYLNSTGTSPWFLNLSSYLEGCLSKISVGLLFMFINWQIQHMQMLALYYALQHQGCSGNIKRGSTVHREYQVWHGHNYYVLAVSVMEHLISLYLHCNIACHICIYIYIYIHVCVVPQPDPLSHGLCMVSSSSYRSVLLLSTLVFVWGIGPKSNPLHPSAAI